MRTFEDERPSGLDSFERLDISQDWNPMHGFWLRFLIAAVTTSVWTIIWIRMSMYGISTSILWCTGVFIVLSMIAWSGFGRQLHVSSINSDFLASIGRDQSLWRVYLGEDQRR